MNRRPIILALVLSLFVVNMGFSASKDAARYMAEPERTQTPIKAQAIQNISSYLDFSLAASSVLADNLVNADTGRIYHEGDFEWNYFTNESTLTDYYWAISALERAYNVTGNATYFSMIGKMATMMITLFMDPVYPGFYIDTWSPEILTQTKRAGIQAYAYKALVTAENVDSELDFTVEKQSAITCLTDMLYDSENGGFHFFTMRNGSLNIPEYIYEVYPPDGKRLDHLALGISALYDAGDATGNSTLTSMANKSLDFLIKYMPYTNATDHFLGLRLATNRTGGVPVIDAGQRPAETVVTDLNAIAIRALLRGYEITGNETYLQTAREAIFVLLNYNWDQENGAFFAETLEGFPYDPLDDEDVKFYKYSEIQFQMVLGLEKLYEFTLDTFYIQLTIDTLDIVIAKLWDSEFGGFWKNGDRESLVYSQSWKTHLAAVQGLAVLAFERVWSFGLPIVSNVRVSPTNPRPTDDITFLVTATDADGIDMVYANMSIEFANGHINRSIVVIPEHPSILGAFNTTIDPLPDGSKINFYIYANDTLGKTFAAGNYNFDVKLDIYEPVILLRTTYPSDEVIAGDEVFIEFGIFEFPIHSAIISCQLFWRLNDGNYAPKNMTWYDIDGQYMLWLVDLGSFSVGDVISFYCIAVDESLNVGQSAFYRLTIISGIQLTPFATWQTLAAVGLVAAPGIGYGLSRIHRGRSMGTQRELKKEARKRSTRKRPRRSRRN